MVKILAAFQFLTIFPAVIRRPFTNKELGHSTALYPIVGLVIGFILLGARNGLSHFFSSQVSSAIVLILWVLLTRAIHLDGFLDSCDGLFGGFTPERRMEIMRDSRVGAFALIGGGVFLITMFTAISSSDIPFTGIILAPVLGRWAITFALVAFPYARLDGMGKEIKDNSNWVQLAISSFTAIVVSWFFAQWIGLIVLGLVFLFSLFFLFSVLKFIPGLTGDIYGATCVLSELLVLIIFSGNFV